MARKENLMIKKLTPVLFVEKIEPVLPFWTEHLGFVKTVEVPDGDRLAFVILQQGAVEVMYQTYASVEKDLPAILPDVRKGPTFLYIEVENLDALKPALKSSPPFFHFLLPHAPPAVA